MIFPPLEDKVDTSTRLVHNYYYNNTHLHLAPVIMKRSREIKSATEKLESHETIHIEYGIKLSVLG